MSCGKGGLYIFYRRGTTPTSRPKLRLPLPEDYSTWEQWPSMPLPEPPPIPRKIHGNGPAPIKKAEAPVAGGKDAWVTLFDGTGLNGWQMGPDRSWRVEDGPSASIEATAYSPGRR